MIWTPETLAAELIRMAPADNCNNCASALYDVCRSLDGRAVCKAYVDGGLKAGFDELLSLVQTAEKERGDA